MPDKNMPTKELDAVVNAWVKAEDAKSAPAGTAPQIEKAWGKFGKRQGLKDRQHMPKGGR